MSTSNRFFLVTGIERIWHWIHAAGILLLVLSGFNIHYAETFNVFGSFENAVKAHNVIGLIVTFDFALWFLYTMVTRRVRYYVPIKDDLPSGMIRQAMFYLMGIFQGKPHPFPVTPDRKFNPLQKWTYIAFMFGMIPLMIVTGLYLYFMVTGYVTFNGVHAYTLSIIHYIGAIFAAFFLFVHVYLGTTGHTPLSLFGTMIHGYHDYDHEEEQ